jgi:hypothetical protein
MDYQLTKYEVRENVAWITFDVGQRLASIADGTRDTLHRADEPDPGRARRAQSLRREAQTPVHGPVATMAQLRKGRSEWVPDNGGQRLFDLRGSG